jgi:hypothetical protein
MSVPSKVTKPSALNIANAADLPVNCGCSARARAKRASTVVLAEKSIR